VFEGKLAVHFFALLLYHCLSLVEKWLHFAKYVVSELNEHHCSRQKSFYLVYHF
jgi:hypothetical protein